MTQTKPKVRSPYKPQTYIGVVLLSGGMDSTTAVAYALGKPLSGGPTRIVLQEIGETNLGSGELLALSFNYGQRHRERELAAAHQIANYYNLDHKVVNLESLGSLLHGSALTSDVDVPEGHYEDASMRQTVVPNRNAIMLSIAFGVARAEGATKVYAGMHSGDHAIYPDCRPAFAHAFDEAMLAANDDIVQDPSAGIGAVPRLVTPFIHMSKTDIVKLGVQYEVPYSLTYSCYKGNLLHCGKCGTCVERKEAFELAEALDPTMYELLMHD